MTADTIDIEAAWATRGLRVVGDVHGDAAAFAAAAATDKFILQLGDLVDDGPDSAGALAIMFRLIDEGRGLFLLGNHDFKLARGLRGDRLSAGSPQIETMAALPAPLAARALDEIRRAPAWARARASFFVHGGFHRGMAGTPPPGFPAGRPDGLLGRALYGQTTGRVTAAGRPERLLAWVDDIPQGLTVYCGHDRRSTDGRPLVREGARGGKAIFLDTGAGKGGHLSWIDLPA